MFFARGVGVQRGPGGGAERTRGREGRLSNNNTMALCVHHMLAGNIAMTAVMQNVVGVCSVGG